MITLGVDVGRTVAQSWFIARDGDNQLIHQQTYIIKPSEYLTAMIYDAVVIEWIDEAAGIYTPVRSRAASVLKTHSTGTTIRDAFLAAGVPVYCVTRREILSQAKLSTRNADKNVLHHLAFLGYLTLTTYQQSSNNKTLKLITKSRTHGLTNPNQRDALMAALFNWRDPRNQQFKAVPNDR